MDKRQEIIKVLSTTALLIMSLLALFGLAACQAHQNPPPILFYQSTSTPLTDNLVEGQSTAAVPAPQESTRVVPIATPTVNCYQQDGDVQSGSFFSEQLGDDFHFRIYLPPCYHAMTDQHYPVVYLLHGLSFNEDQWLRLGVAEHMDRMITDGALPPFMIVLPGEARFDPPPTSAFADALVQELIPWVDGHFRTLPEKPFRSIGGLSRGAAWSVHIGLWHYPLFDSVGAHSLPLFEVDSLRITAWLTQIPIDDVPTFLIDIGRQDPERWTAQNFADQLNDHKVPHTWYLFNGGHSEDYWSTHLELYLRWYARNW